MPKDYGNTIIDYNSCPQAFVSSWGKRLLPANKQVAITDEQEVRSNGQPVEFRFTMYDTKEQKRITVRIPADAMREMMFGWGLLDRSDFEPVEQENKENEKDD